MFIFIGFSFIGIYFFSCHSLQLLSAYLSDDIILWPKSK